MPRTKPSMRRVLWGMIVCRQIATRDDRLPRVVAQTVVTNADLDWNEACMGACTAAGAVLREMPNPIERDGLEDALGRVFSAFDMTDWVYGLSLLLSIGFGVCFGPVCSRRPSMWVLRLLGRLSCQCGVVCPMGQICCACIGPCLGGR
jgi:hypothetical protein